MPKFAANLTMLFNEVPFLERFAAASNAGFRAVEYLFPYAHPVAELAARLRGEGLQQVLFNLPAGNWEAGDRGIAVDPARVDEFRAGVERALDYAGALGCGQLNCLVGIGPAGVEEARMHATLVQNLAHAAAKLAAAGLRLLVEPLNTRDVPGFRLVRTQDALALMQEVGAPNLYLQYDAYHMQIMEGDLVRTIEANLARIAHVQIADNPGRHEPGTGEIHYPFVFRELDRMGYQGWVGCEYRPATTTLAGLTWRDRE